MIRRSSKAPKFVVAFLVSVLGAGGALADRAVLPLGRLIEMSDLVVIAKVTGVAEGSSPGEQIAALEAEQWLKGSGPEKLAVGGSTLDPGLPDLSAGTRVLAFLKRGERSTYEAVEGDHGIVEIGEGSVRSAAQLVKSAMATDVKLQMKTLTSDFRAAAPPLPPVLAASYLEELTRHTTSEHAHTIRDLACDEKRQLSVAAREWAVTRAGALKVSEARPCLENLLREGSHGRLRIAAIEALGEIADPASAPLLRSLMPELESKPGPEGTPEESPPEGESRAPRPKHDDGDTKADRLEDPEDVSIGDRSLQARESGGESAAIWGEGRSPDGEPPLDDDSGAKEPSDESAFAGRLDAAETESALLALGKIGATESVPTLLRFAKTSDDPALQSTAVHALGLIGSPEARRALGEMSEAPVSELIRDQAMRTKARLEEHGGN